MQRGSSDRLDFSRNAFLILWACTLSFTLLVSVSGLFLHRSLPGPSLALMKRLDLTTLSLVPSGQVLREPAILHPGVDLRMVPTVAPVDLGSASLFLSVD